jgi:ferrochelatase
MGVVVMAYGTPSSYEDVEAFYTDVRRGRPPTPEQLEGLRGRYRAVGGVSELGRRTAEQVAGIQAALGSGYACFYGAKHAAPFIEDAVDAVAEAGLGRFVGLVLAPHYSSGSVGQYLERAAERAAAVGLGVAFVEDWHDDPVLVELLADRVEAARDSLGLGLGLRASARWELLVTAHSLPVRIIEAGDGYDRRLAETGALVAARAGVEHWRVCWQSAGRTPEPWIGPDVLEVLRGLPAEGVEAAVVCPAGFTSDHLEVSYDLDIEARAVAEEVGLAFTRTASLNADERMCAELAQIVMDARTAAGW